MLRQQIGAREFLTDCGLFKMKLLVKTAILIGLVLANSAWGDRVKDLTSVAGVRPNQLIGYGLVVGLSGTGDRDKISFNLTFL